MSFLMSFCFHISLVFKTIITPCIILSRPFFILVFIFLTGCVTPPSFQSDRQYSSAHEIQRWQAQGKLGVRLPNESKAVNFTWQQDGNDFKIQLYGTLGLGNISLEQKKEQATLSTSDGKRYAASAGALIEEAIGSAIPIGSLNHWMKGVSVPHFSSNSEPLFNADNTLKSLHQENWKVEYRSYHPASPIALPRKIIVSRDDTRITLVIKEWQY